MIILDFTQLSLLINSFFHYKLFAFEEIIRLTVLLVCIIYHSQAKVVYILFRHT